MPIIRFYVVYQKTTTTTFHSSLQRLLPDNHSPNAALPQKKTGFISALVARVPVNKLGADRNSRPFSREAELLKPAANPVPAEVQTPAAVPGGTECTNQF